MRLQMQYYFLSFCIFFLLYLPAQAQSDSAVILISELHTKTPLAFAVVRTNNNEGLADLDGKYFFHNVDFPAVIKISHNLYREVEFTVPDKASLPDTIYLHRKDAMVPAKYSDPEALEVIRIAEKRKKRSALRGPFRYTSYNKFTVDTKRSGKQEKLVDQALDFLTYDYETLDSLHLYMMESISIRNKENFINEKEEITAARSSGLILPHFYAYIIHPHPVDLSKDYLHLANTEYIAPLCKNPWKTYSFSMIDTIHTESGKIFAIQFTPLPGKIINAVQGMLYISEDTYYPVAFFAGPAQEKSLEMRVYQEYMEVGGKSAPYRYRTSLSFEKRGAGEVKVNMNGRSVLYHFESKDSLKKYDEVVLDFQSESFDHPEQYWHTYRQEPLSGKDSITFEHPPRIKKVPAFLFHLGEHIYFGKVPAGKVDIDLSKVVSTNYQEGLRLGMGFITNSTFSPNWKFAAYGGVGLKDKRWKYGISASYKVPHPAEPVAEVFYASELLEAGGFSFPYDFNQYNTEHLRKYRLSIMDYTSEAGGNFYLHPLRNLRLRGKLSSARYTPSYNYTYTPSPETNAFNFIEASLGLRYAYGEQYIKTSDYDIYLGSRFPVLWVNYTQAAAAFGTDKTFHRLDIKLQQTVRIFRFGTSGLQLLMGLSSKDAPYMKLYNGMGSLRNLSPVTNNSFETMHYNEFLSDRFFAVFYSHDFGRIYNPNPKIQPDLVMVHNFGWGKLSEPGNHETFIPFKTMEKGYFESGLFIKNLYIVNLTALKTGLGFGFFWRYGPYAHEDAHENVVFKLALNFML